MPRETSVHRPALLRYLGYATSAAIVGWLLFVVLPDLGDLDEAGELLVAHLRVIDVLVAAALLVAYIVTHALTLTTATPGASFPAALLVRAVSGGFARFIPAGFAVGAAVMARMLRSRGVRASAIAHAIAVTSVWNTLTKLALPLLGLAAVAIAGTAPFARGPALAALTAVGVIVVLGGLRLLAREPVARRLARMVQRPVAAVAHRTGRVAPVDLPERAVELQASTAQALRERPYAMAFWYTAHHLTQVGLIWVGMRAAARGGGLELGWPELLLAFSIGYLLTGLPISPGGLGTLDVAVVAVLTALGEEPAVVSAGLVVYRLATYGLYVVVFVGWPLWRPGTSTPRDPPAT